MKKLYPLLFLLICQLTYAQENILVTNPEADAVLKGNFEAADYLSATIINHPDDVIPDLIDRVSPDSLKTYLEILNSFDNRNTGSDTSSTTFGFGAARRWAFSKFESFSERNENRLLPAYLQFDQVICGMGQHRNIFAVLPGSGPQRHEIVLVEGHMDSRCEDPCDVNCDAPGIDDNGSGTALVLEMARVMSQYTFNRTLVFLITTGEEQGLFGANAFATYCADEGIDVYAVLNNDIVGGIICGQTASPPGCPGLNDIDSINVRIYSLGISTSKYKNLARFIKLEYEEEASQYMTVQPVINIMTPEDRGGRGGDHIPFRQKDFTSVRFTSANEHGNGNPSTPDYSDRQHTTHDILGVDTDGDEAIDSFFVDFNYLARNAMINGNAMAAAAMGPIMPELLEAEDIDIGIKVTITDPEDYNDYRIALRTVGNLEWDTLIDLSTKVDTITALGSGIYYLTVCTVDSNGVESLFPADENVIFTTDVEDLPIRERGIELLQNRPNPFDDATTISIRVDRNIDYQEANIVVTDLQGRQLATYPVDLQPGIVEVVYDYRHHRYQPGTYAYSLYIDGRLFQTKQMIYAY